MNRLNWLGVFLGATAGLAMLLFSGLSVFEPLEQKTLDWRFRWRDERIPKSDITIILAEKKYRDGLSRKNYASFIKRYRAASAIGLDLVLDERNEAEDLYLETVSAIAKVYHVFGKLRKGAAPYYENELQKRVAALKRFRWGKRSEYEGKLERLEKDRIVAPLPEFADTAIGVGHAYAVEPPQDVLRKIPLLIEYEGSVYPLLSLQMACDFLQVTKKEVHLGKYIRLVTEKGETIRIPIDKKGYMSINYVGRFEKFDTYPLSQMLGENSPTVSGIILVGAMTEEEGQPLVDDHLTPFGVYPGVGIHANILENILQQDFLNRVGTPIHAVTFLVLGVVVGIIGTSRRASQARIPAFRGSALAIILCVYLFIAFLLFKVSGIWLEVAAPFMVLSVALLTFFVVDLRSLAERKSKDVASSRRSLEMTQQFPTFLINELKNGNGVLFVGAGLSVGAGLPSWNQLVEPLADEIGAPKGNLLKIPQYYVQHNGSRVPLYQYLKKKIKVPDATPTENHRLLAQLPARIIFTTNYDELLESTLREAQVAFHRITLDKGIGSWNEAEEVQLVKLHGSIDDEQTIVITEDDYRTYFDEHPAMRQQLASLLMTKTFLFVGYSLNDPNFNFVYDQIQTYLDQEKRPAYAFMFNVNPFDIDDYRHRGLQIINITVEADADNSAALQKVLESLVSAVKETEREKKR